MQNGIKKQSHSAAVGAWLSRPVYLEKCAETWSFPGRYFPGSFIVWASVVSVLYRLQLCCYAGLFLQFRSNFAGISMSNWECPILSKCKYAIYFTRGNVFDAHWLGSSTAFTDVSCHCTIELSLSSVHIADVFCCFAFPLRNLWERLNADLTSMWSGTLNPRWAWWFIRFIWVSFPHVDGL